MLDHGPTIVSTQAASRDCANGAAVISAWGGVPGKYTAMTLSAEGATHLRGLSRQRRGRLEALNRAFSAWTRGGQCSWGVAPGWHEAAPLALMSPQSTCAAARHVDRLPVSANGAAVISAWGGFPIGSTQCAYRYSANGAAFISAWGSAPIGSTQCAYRYSANGAAVISAWGSAPGKHALMALSAEGAIHSRGLSRQRHGSQGSWGVAPSWHEAAPLAPVRNVWRARTGRRAL
jgi:hypothetical protein